MARNYNEAQLHDWLINLVAETTIGRRADGEESRTFQVNIGELPLVSLEKIIAYGTQRYINDKVGGSDKDMKTKCDLASEIIIDLYEGNVSKRRESVPEDSMSAFRITALKELLGKEQWKAVNKLENKADVIKQLVAANGELLEPRALELKAEAEAAREKAKALAGKLDLSALGIKL